MQRLWGGGKLFKSGKNAVVAGDNELGGVRDKSLRW